MMHNRLENQKKTLSEKCFAMLASAELGFDTFQRNPTHTELAPVLNQYCNILNLLQEATISSSDGVVSDDKKVANSSTMISMADSVSMVVSGVYKGLTFLINVCQKADRLLPILELSYLVRSSLVSTTDHAARVQVACTDFLSATTTRSEHILMHPVYEQFRTRALLNFSNMYKTKSSLKTNKFSEVERKCTQLLLSNESNAKFNVEIYLQRAQANKKLGNYHDSFIDYSTAYWMVRSRIKFAPLTELQRKSKQAEIDLELSKVQKLIQNDKSKNKKMLFSAKTFISDETRKAEAEYADAMAKELENEIENEKIIAPKQDKKKNKRKVKKKENVANKKPEEQKESDPSRHRLEAFKPEMLSPALSHEMIASLINLNAEIEDSIKNSRNKEAHLEIYGSFVLYYALISLGEKPNWNPRDLDLIVHVKDMLFARGGILIEKLNDCGFCVTETNENKNYVKLDKASTAADSYDMSITLAFRGYESVNPIHLTRHRIQFNGQTGMLSFDGDNDLLKNEFLDAILLHIGRVDLSEMAKPSLDMINVFSRLLKFYDDFKDKFEMDKETTMKALTDVEWISAYFYNRLNTSSLDAVKIDAALQKNNCYLEIADLIARNYFLREESQPIIRGFISGMIQVYYQENVVEPLSVADAASVVNSISGMLYNKYKAESYQSVGKKKPKIIADFHCFLIRAIRSLLPVTDVNEAGVLSPPQIINRVPSLATTPKKQTFILNPLAREFHPVFSTVVREEKVVSSVNYDIDALPNLWNKKISNDKATCLPEVQSQQNRL